MRSFCRILRRIPIRVPLVSLCFFCFLLWLEPSSYTLIPLCAALLHECGHLVAMLWAKQKVECITLYPFGVDIRCHGATTWGQDLLVNGAGVLCNLLACAFCMPHLEYGAIQFFFASNLLLALLNLLPVQTLDGYAILSCLFAKFGWGARGRSILSRLSFCALLLLWIIATYLLFFTAGSFSFFSMTLYLFACLFLGNPKTSI